VWYKNLTDLSSVLSQSRVWQTDRQTDWQTNGRTEFSSLDRVCIPCCAVKVNTSELGRDLVYLLADHILSLTLTAF